ncbi:phosphoglycolate phosphatase [Frigidibacter sp. MR17.14]|uniref:phosphoglycolate phosphatase n=1 Tax=Frigidibacter sp. MR17.14 TaxID=3126509 RepID=UPI0030130080
MARIIFDLDGTLINSAPDVMGVANAILAEQGVAPISLAQTRSFIGNGVATFVARMRAARALPETLQAPMLDAFRARYDAAVGATLPYPGVATALARLGAAGHAIGLCTNKPVSAARAVLGHVGLLPAFDAIIGGDSLALQKPDPAPLLAVLDALPPGPALYVGDSEVDAETAAAAGLPFLLYTGGYSRGPASAIAATARFAHHAALPDLVAAALTEAAGC